MSLKNKLAEKFVNTDAIAEIIEIGIQTKKNVFLYGRGGHAKSEIAQAVLDYVDPQGCDSFVLACGEGLTEEKLFGGIDIAKFQKTGVIEHLVHNSFMNYKYVVFEELLDSRMNVLLSLKDILTSGKFRHGNQTFKIKTEFVLCLTNRTKQEVAEDNSVKALLERFPLEMKVEWDRYNQEDYERMFFKVLGKNYTEVARICHVINDTGEFVSPRTAIHMAQVFQSKGLQSLRYFGMGNDIIEAIQKEEKDRTDVSFLKHYIDSYDNLKMESNIPSVKAFIKACKSIQEQITTRGYSDKVFPLFKDLREKLTSSLAQARTVLAKIVENE